jgi:hypothetical protein
VTAGLAAADEERGEFGAEVNGGRDMLSASLSGAGRKGGTPRPLSGDEWAEFIEEARKSELDCSASESSGTDGGPGGSGTPIVAGLGSSGLRRLNKTLYQTKKGAFAYHGAQPPNN